MPLEADGKREEKRLESFYFGNSEEVRKERELILRAADTDGPVTITGPSGNSKDRHGEAGCLVAMAPTPDSTGSKALGMASCLPSLEAIHKGANSKCNGKP